MKSRKRQQKEKPPWTNKTLFDITTGERAPQGARHSEKYISFISYVATFVTQGKRAQKTYVDDKGNRAAGVTKATCIAGFHRTLFNWNLQQKRNEFINILKAGGHLPPTVRKRKRQLEKNANIPETEASNKGQQKKRRRELFDTSTGRAVPRGTPKCDHHLTFDGYLMKFVRWKAKDRKTYVDDEGKVVDGVTKETLHSWRVKQKRKEFRAILKAGGQLPLPPERASIKQSLLATRPSGVLPEAESIRPLTTELKLDQDSNQPSSTSTFTPQQPHKSPWLLAKRAAIEPEPHSVARSSAENERLPGFFDENALSLFPGMGSSVAMNEQAPSTLDEDGLSLSSEIIPPAERAALSPASSPLSDVDDIPVEESLSTIQVSGSALFSALEPSEQAPMQMKKMNLHRFFSQQASEITEPASLNDSNKKQKIISL